MHTYVSCCFFLILLVMTTAAVSVSGRFARSKRAVVILRSTELGSLPDLLASHTTSLVSLTAREKMGQQKMGVQISTYQGKC